MIEKRKNKIYYAEKALVLNGHADWVNMYPFTCCTNILLSNTVVTGLGNCQLVSAPSL